MQEKLKQENTLSQSEIEKIVHRYVLGHDKWYRMLQGMGSELKSYEDSIMYINMSNSEEKVKSSPVLAKKIAIGWFLHNEELHNAKGFIVSIFKDSSLINTYSGMIDKSKYQNEINENNRLKKETAEIVLKNKNIKKDTESINHIEDEDEPSFAKHQRHRLK